MRMWFEIETISLQFGGDLNEKIVFNRALTTRTKIKQRMKKKLTRNAPAIWHNHGDYNDELEQRNIK